MFLLCIHDKKIVLHCLEYYFIREKSNNLKGAPFNLVKIVRCLHFREAVRHTMHICFLFVYAWAEALFDNQMVSWKTYPKLAFGLYFTGEFLQNTIDTKITVLLDVEFRTLQSSASVLSRVEYCIHNFFVY